jgi:hypothetical protein
MKIGKNVQIYGIERIIFDKVTEYKLIGSAAKNNLEWTRAVSPRNGETTWEPIPHQQMAQNIYRICNTKEYEVGFNGNMCFVDSKRCKVKKANRNDIVVMLCGECPRHGE